MPGTSKTKWAQLKVGLLAIAALAILGFLIFLMAGVRGFFTPKNEIYTYLNDSEAVVATSPVTLNGINVGEVSKVGFSGSSEPNRVVKVTMEIETRFLSSIPVDSLAELTASNLLGTKYINIKKGKSAVSIQPGQEIASSESAELEDVFRQSSETLGALQKVVTQLGGIMDQIESGKGNLGKLLVDETLYDKVVAITDTFESLATNFQTTLKSSDNSLGKLLHDNDEIYNDVHGLIAQSNGLVVQVGKMVDGINNGKGTVGQLMQNPAAYDDARQILADVHQLLAGLQAGEGTAGKLLKSNELSDELKSTLGRVDALLDKMSNGQGTLARLLNDPGLADDMDGLLRETHGLIKDFRTNPKKFLHIKIGLF